MSANKVDYKNSDNELDLGFINSTGNTVNFCIPSSTDDPHDDIESVEFMKFLNQLNTNESYTICETPLELKAFTEV